MKDEIINLSVVAFQEWTLSRSPLTHLLKPKVIRVHAPKLLRGSNTRKQIIELRLAHLSMTMSEIAKIVGVSRQRVFQILREDGLPTKHHVIIEKFQYQYQCLVCGTVSPHKFCSDECKKKWQQIPVVCTRCGRLFFRNITQLLHNYRRHDKGLFCSKHCTAKWLAEIYGFKSSVNRIASLGCLVKGKWD